MRSNERTLVRTAHLLHQTINKELCSSLDHPIDSIMTDVDPLQLLTADLQSNDYETIIQSVNQIITVAIALGPDRTRAQLLPLLGEFAGISNNQSLNSNNQTLDVENDEAQTAVARQLALFTPLIGGPQYLHLLLPLMEKYCGEEEFVVRNTVSNI